jgi:sugar lactone lactonase YvrE
MRGVPKVELLAAALLLAGCGHAAAASAAVMGPVPSAWPPPPAAARARLVSILPDPHAPPRPQAWWRTAFEWITGASLAKGEADGLDRPFGVALAADGAPVVADPDAGSVSRLTPAGATEPLGCSKSEWSAPMALSFGPDGSLFVADAGLAAIVKVRGKECSLLGLGELERPTGVALFGDRVIVADPPRHQLVVLSIDGKVLSRWGAQGAGEGQFAFPTSVAAASDSLVVTDALNFRVVRMDTDGRWISAFGSSGDGAGHFERPKGIALDAEGRVYVSDAQRDLVLVFSSGGEFEYSIGEPGEGPGQFALPAGLAIVKDRLYVADSQNRRIQVFELIGGPP